jgi:hypothetical protein
LGMLRVFIGVDPRQPVGFNVLQWSIHKHAKQRVIVEPLMLPKLPITRRGLTEFTFSRYLVPWLCGFEGSAVFMDADIVVTGDIGELFAEADGISAVQVNQDQPKFEWPSVMLFNNEHCKVLTPEYVDNPQNKCNALDWGPVGRFSPEWNYCVNKVEPNPNAKLYHYTEGLPIWDEVRNGPDDKQWLGAHAEANHTVSWRELMGGSVHAEPVIKRYLARKFGITARSA